MSSLFLSERNEWGLYTNWFSFHVTGLKVSVLVLLTKLLENELTSLNN